MLYYANLTIAGYDKDPSIVVVDAFSAFAGKQDKLILPGDVHPNAEGQDVLADLALEVIEELQ